MEAMKLEMAKHMAAFVATGPKVVNLAEGKDQEQAAAATEVQQQQQEREEWEEKQRNDHREEKDLAEEALAEASANTDKPQTTPNGKGIDGKGGGVKNSSKPY